MTSHKRKMKSRDSSSSSSSSSSTSDSPFQTHHMTALMLAAYHNLHKPYAQSLMKSLQKTHLANLRTNHSSLQEILPDSLLSLLPALLNSRHLKVAVLSAEIVGSCALCSFDAHERIALDKEIMGGLVSALSSGSKKFLKAVVSTVLDLSTTSIGREQLHESSAIEKLMSLCCQVATCPIKSGSPYSKENGSSSFLARFMEDKLLVLVIDSIITLANSCSIHHLAKIPREVGISFLLYLKELWVQPAMFPSNVKSTDLAETIFRLSVNYGSCMTCTFDVVNRSIFSVMESDFEKFMSNYWENVPFLLKNILKIRDRDDDPLNSLLQSYKSKTIDSILDSLLVGLVSCPPIASDELHIFDFVKEMKDQLGCPIIYGQDIRIVKTVELASGSAHQPLNTELHFSDCMGPSGVSVQKCKEAFHKGYTVALRGMEFRSDKIATIADGLAKLFGQPSVGANMYLTPPRSQGLSLHYDDHCVFICQLVGNKQWTIFPRLDVLLPRLYEPPGSLHVMDGSEKSEGKQFLLKEGEILYIPRGCPHKAHTVICKNEAQMDASTGFSLHLTLGIEVEPPFEWEGFAHVALHCWNQSVKPATQQATKSVFGIPNIMSVTLLHVSIKLIGDHDSTFRKACMVAAFSLPLDFRRKQLKSFLNLDQRVTFAYVIDRINSESNFIEAFRIVEAAVHEKNEDSFQWIRWIRHLPQNGEASEETVLNKPLKALEDLVLLYNEHMVEALSAFMVVKSNFCKEVVFEEVCKSFEMLLEKYKETREQYMKGMLALHRNN